MELWTLLILSIVIILKKSGKISIISSVAGYRGLPAAGGYCASKSALTSFTESLYFDMKRKNVDVKLISPGL